MLGYSSLLLLPAASVFLCYLPTCLVCRLLFFYDVDVTQRFRRANDIVSDAPRICLVLERERFQRTRGCKYDTPIMCRDGVFAIVVVVLERRRAASNDVLENFNSPGVSSHRLILRARVIRHVTQCPDRFHAMLLAHERAQRRNDA